MSDNMKKTNRPAARVLAAAALVLALGTVLAGCGFRDTMLYLYGGDGFVEGEKEPAYLAYTGDNGITVVYDSNIWMEPSMAQADTISIAAGGSFDTTAVLLQVTDAYTDFLAQSGADIEEETQNGTVKYEYDFTVPEASVAAVRYDCGSYQTIFAQIDYERGGTLYVTAATKLGDESLITGLLQNVYPEGEAPDGAAVPAGA